MVDGRDKGQAYMRDVCLRLNKWTGGSFRPRPTFVEPSEGWSVKGDVQHSTGLWFPFSVECKKIEGWELGGMFEEPKWAVWKWWRQCVSQAETAENTTPLLIFSRNRRRNYALTPAHTLKWMKFRPLNGPHVVIETPLGETLGLCLLDDLVLYPIPRSSPARGW